MSSTKKDFEPKTEEKKEVFQPPKATDVEGKEIKSRVGEKDLEGVSGGVSDGEMVPGHLCLGGG